MHIEAKYHNPVWSKMVNILRSKQDTKLVPMAICSPIIKKLSFLPSAPEAQGIPSLYMPLFEDNGGNKTRPYDNKSRHQIALYVFSFDQIPYYGAINIWYNGHNTPRCESRQWEVLQQLGSL